MLKKFKEAIKKKSIWSTFNHLSKAFNCIDHKPLLAKLYEYDVSSSVLIINSSYLKHGSERTRTDNCFIARSNIEYGVPQGSILGSLLFNINMTDLFYEC